MTQNDDQTTPQERYEAGAERARRWYDRSGLAARPPATDRLGGPYVGPIPTGTEEEK